MERESRVTQLSPRHPALAARRIFDGRSDRFPPDPQLGIELKDVVRPLSLCLGRARVEIAAYRPLFSR